SLNAARRPSPVALVTASFLVHATRKARARPAGGTAASVACSAADSTRRASASGSPSPPSGRERPSSCSTSTPTGAPATATATRPPGPGRPAAGPTRRQRSRPAAAPGPPVQPPRQPSGYLTGDPRGRTRDTRVRANGSPPRITFAWPDVQPDSAHPPGQS